MTVPLDAVARQGLGDDRLAGAVVAGAIGRAGAGHHLAVGRDDREEIQVEVQAGLAQDALDLLPRRRGPATSGRCTPRPAGRGRPSAGRSSSSPRSCDW